jgi:uncharacterized membrane protein
VLGPAVQLEDGVAGQPGREPGRKRPAQVGAAQDDLDDALADENRREQPANGFDFRKLGHARQSSARNPAGASSSDTDMSDAISNPIVVDARPSASLVSWTQVIYALHAVSLLTGVLGAASVVGAFLIGWPSVVAVIVNYVKRGEARGTWLDSHFRWQIRTFWFGLLWAVLCLAFVVMTLGIGLIVVWIPLGVLTLWFIYRVARGWSALASNEPMYS